MYKIIDSHTHTYPDSIAAKAAKNLGEFYHFTVSESGTFTALEECERSAGIGGFLLLPTASAPRNVDKINEAAAEQVKQARKDGFEAESLGCMHPDYPDFRSGLIRCLELGLKGIKLHPDLLGENADSERLFALYEIMQEYDMILWLHVGDAREQVSFSSPDRVVNIARTFPKLKICAAHLGGYRVWEHAEKVLMGKYENVRYDCSSTLETVEPKRAKYWIEKCGVDRVMFGSDYPAISPADALAEFLRLDFSEEVRNAILYENIKRYVGFGDAHD